MDAPRAAVRLSVVAVAGLLVALVVVSVAQEGTAVNGAVTQRDGTPFEVPHEVGAYETTWMGYPVMLVVTTKEHLAGVEALRGKGEATPAVPIGDGLVVFAFSGRDNFLGCTLAFNQGLGASKDIADYDGDGIPDGRALGRCHFEQYDLYHRGENQPGTPAKGPLAQLRLGVEDGRAIGHGFTSAVSPPRPA